MRLGPFTPVCLLLYQCLRMVVSMLRFGDFLQPPSTWFSEDASSPCIQQRIRVPFTYPFKVGYPAYST